MNINIENVQKQYGAVTALDGPSFDIPSGSTFGVLGTNGAGKTTLFELLVGHDEPDAGRITVGGLDATTAGHSVRERVGFLPERVGFPGIMSGREVLSVHARIRGIGSDRNLRIEEALETVGLADDADRAVSGYSNGMRRRLGLAGVLLADPPVLVLDEPTAGLDPQGVEDFHRIVERIDRETDATVVLSSHVLPEVERLCDEVAILHDGQLCAAGSVEELRQDVDGLATVRVRPITVDTRSEIRETLARFGSVTGANGTLELACEREEVLAVVDAIDDDAIADLEIDTPGLETVFQQAVGGRMGVSES